MSDKPSANSTNAANQEGNTQGTLDAPPSLPRDVHLLANMLQEVGISNYDPRLITQMIEFAYRYTTDLLLESKSISDFTGKKLVDDTDALFASNSTDDKRYGTVTDKNRKLVLELAHQKNLIPLPTIKQNSGLRLPNDRFCLMNPSFVWQNAHQVHNAPHSRAHSHHDPPDNLSADKVMRLLNQQNPMKRKASSPLDDEYD